MIGLCPPEHWETKHLGEIAEIERESVAPEAITTGTRYLGLEHLGSDGSIADVQTVENGDLASNKFRFTSSHILYGKLRPYLSKIVRPSFEGVCSTDILPIRPKPCVSKDYLFYYLRHPRMVEFASVRSEGANLPRLSPTQLERFPIFLPPTLKEQYRIATILDKADAIRRKQSVSIQLSESVLPAVFVGMFGPDGSKYDLEPLDRHVEFLTSGSRGWAEHYVRSGKRFIRSLDVQMNRIGSDEIVYVNPPAGAEAERTRVHDGDVLVTITGSRVGRVAFVPDKFGEAYVSQHVAIVRLKPTLRSRFCSMFLSLPTGGQRQIAKAQYGQTKPGLSLTNIREFQVPIPPLHEQDHFLAIWDRHGAVSDRHANCSAEMSNLFEALTQRAFRGLL